MQEQMAADSVAEFISRIPNLDISFNTDGRVLTPGVALENGTTYQLRIKLAELGYGSPLVGSKMYIEVNCSSYVCQVIGPETQSLWLENGDQNEIVFEIKVDPPLSEKWLKILTDRAPDTAHLSHFAHIGIAYWLNDGTKHQRVIAKPIEKPRIVS